MCVIIKLPPKKIISFEKFKNATLNNPDGWGIVFVDRGELTARKECDPDKGNDPDELYKILQDSFGIQRFIHVRKNTVGKTNVDNTHPFTVMNKEGGRRIEFMHNGTIGEYRPTQPSEISDTRNYAESFLSPLLEHFSGEKGIGDYTDPFFELLVKRTFDYSNRGLLISNDLEAKEFGHWEEFKDGDEVFRVSNDDYFNVIMSGRTKNKEVVSPYSDSRFRRAIETPTQETLALTHAARSSVPQVENAKYPSVTPLKDINLKKVVSKEIKAEDMNDLMELSIKEFDEIGNEQLEYYQYMSRIEIEGWVRRHPATASKFIELMLIRLNDTQEELNAEEEVRMEAQEKHARATKRCEELAYELNERDKALGSVAKVNRPARTRNKKAA